MSWSPLEQLRLPNAVPTSCDSNLKVSISDELLSTKYAFVRHDDHRTPLQRLYDGPYDVILPGSKTFGIRVSDRKEIIAIDRLKTSHTDPDTPITVSHPPRRGTPPSITNPRKDVNTHLPPTINTSRSGRQVKQPDRDGAV